MFEDSERAVERCTAEADPDQRAEEPDSVLLVVIKDDRPAIAVASGMSSHSDPW